MDERKMRNLALLCSFLGIIVLIFVSYSIGVPQVNITDITIGDVGRNFLVCGVVKNIEVSKNHMFFDIEDKSGKMRAVIFNDTALDLIKSGMNPYELKPNDMLCSDMVVDEWPKGSGNLELVSSGGTFEKL